MDLVTPARTWAAAETAEVIPAAPVRHMPPFQTAVMFCSVVGPFVGLLAAIFLLWHRTGSASAIGWPEITIMIAMYSLCGFSVTIGFHRLLTHKAFETYKPIKWLMAIFASAAGQGMCIRWCATHRRHHQQADLEGDPHSPHLHGDSFGEMFRGFWHAHVGWCFLKDKDDLARSVPDLLGDPVLVWIDQLYFLWVGLGIFVPGLLLGWYYHSWHGFISGMIWGGLLRIFLVQHVTWSVNSVCHVWGSRPFQTADYSTNNLPVAILSLGEGWHNNHHTFPTSARHGLRWWQFDSSWMVIQLMKWTHLAWNIRLPSPAALQARLKKAAPSEPAAV